MFIDLSKVDRKKELNPEERKTIILKVLEEFASFCDSHDLKYSLSYGTLLGAIRHRGFIPWDDDVDVMMPREDYKKFLELYKSDKYKIISVYNNKLYYLPFAKFYDSTTIKVTAYNFKKQNSFFGLEIDIFPFDYLTNSEIYNNLVKKQEKLADNWNKTVAWYPTFIHCVKHPKLLFNKYFYKGKTRFYAKKFDQISQIKNNCSNFTIKYDFFFRKIHCYKGDLFSDLITAEFEGRQFKILRNCTRRI